MHEQSRCRGCCSCLRLHTRQHCRSVQQHPQRLADNNNIAPYAAYVFQLPDNAARIPTMMCSRCLPRFLTRAKLFDSWISNVSANKSNTQRRAMPQFDRSMIPIIANPLLSQFYASTFSAYTRSPTTPCFICQQLIHIDRLNLERHSPAQPTAASVPPATAADAVLDMIHHRSPSAGDVAASISAPS